MRAHRCPCSRRAAACSTSTKPTRGQTGPCEARVPSVALLRMRNSKGVQRKLFTQDIDGRFHGKGCSRDARGAGRRRLRLIHDNIKAFNPDVGNIIGTRQGRWPYPGQTPIPGASSVPVRWSRLHFIPVHTLLAQCEELEVCPTASTTPRVHSPRACGTIAFEIPMIKFVTDRSGHERRYATAPTNIATELAWHAQETFESGIEKTVQSVWYQEHSEWIERACSNAYRHYYEQMYGLRQLIPNSSSQMRRQASR